MKKITFLYLLVLLSISSKLIAQQNKFIVVYKDKSGSNIQLANTLSPKALQKREQQNIPFDKYDVPVSKHYLAQIERDNKVINSSKWLNASLIKSDFTREEILSRYSFIKQVIPIVSKPEKNIPLMGSSGNRADPALYNYTYNQLETTKTASCLHDNGYKGQGVLIAVLDAGFPKIDSMLAFSNLRTSGRIVDTWDFEDNAPFIYHKHGHGTFVSSIITAELDSTFIGSAPEANFAFYITEIASVEINQEEYNLVMGLERADSIGADIASISLGYRDFDTLQISYGYPGMDGQTTIVSQGVKVARNKGIIVVASAGNNGNQGSGSIASPCDTDSILCIGAINYDSTKASFSSEGPTFDGRIKPDITNIGDSCYYVGTDDTARSGNGTSFSCPLTSGLVACLKQAHPNRTNFQIMDAMKQGADRASSPDNLFGWGIPNGCKVDSILTVLDSVYAGLPEKETFFDVTLYPNPSVNELTISSKNIINQLVVLDLNGKKLTEHHYQTYEAKRSINVSELAKGKYIIYARDVNNLTSRMLFMKM